MAVKVTLHNSSKITRRTPHEGPDNGTGISRHTYQKLGSLIQNKELVQSYDEGTLPLEYVRLLDELNDLFIYKNYPLLGQDIVVKEGIEKLDEYLGNLGITQDYSYSKDTVDIPAWTTASSRSEVRILADNTDNTILADGTDILVSYNY